MKVDHNELAAVHAAGIRLDIPYTKLRLSTTYQARQAQDRKHEPEIFELKATIKAMGCVLQNLVVVECPDGAYEVCAGGRRWTAIGLLIEDGSFSADYMVPCLGIPPEYAHHASLIENIGRKAMHPADTYTAYAQLRADGWTVEAIAAAHGASEAGVKKLLALGGVAPSLMQLFRDDKIDIAEMQALASVADHDRQEAAWKAAKGGYWHTPSKIRQLLAEKEMRGDSAVARYVTVAAYEKAGGAVRRDLFAQDAYLDDPEKVRAMALAKMPRSKLAKAIEGEGWGWVEYRLSISHDERKRFGEIQRAHLEPNKDQAKLLKALETKINAAEAKAGELNQADEANGAKLETLRANIQGWRNEIVDIRSALYDYPVELKPLAGVVIHLDHSGDLGATRGLIRQDDREAVTALVRSISPAEGQPQPAVDLPPVKTRPVHSEGLTNRLQAQRVIALQAEIIQQPSVALCLLVDQLLLDVLRDMERWRYTRVFDLSAHDSHHDLTQADQTMEQCPAWAAVQARIEAVTRDVPKGRDADVLAWLMQQHSSIVLNLLGVLVSMTIFCRRAHGSGPEDAHLERLARVVDLDMAKWWQPTADAYLNHVSKDRIAAVVTDAVGAEAAQPLLAMKKGEAAAAAERLLAGRRWVPELMRGPEPKDEPMDGNESDAA